MFNFIKKNFALIFIILFIIIFSVFNKQDFIKNYEDKNNLEKQKINLNQKLENFDLDNLKEIENLEFYYTPYKELLDKIINEINTSKNRVFVEVYMLTEKRIKNALIKAKNRGLEVRVVLEKSPYKSTNINNKHFNFLRDSGIDIVWSNPDLYSLNHSKFMIFDDEVMISSGNFTYSTFAFNRDLFLFTDDKNILDSFEKIFKQDYGQKSRVVYNDNLVLSPDYSRFKFEKLFKKSSKSIDMYFQYLQDNKLEKILIKKAKSGVKIRLIVSGNFWKDDKDKINFLEKNNIEIKPLIKNKMHSKAILIDNKYLFIGSVNFSNYSLDKNRETGLILLNKNIISKFRELFEKDFAK